ncbi:MAG: polyprenyl synthetase family protein [Candidatus Nanohaloarchaea archaeon]|nr:polyprenyl synthetase family protein [Candidatus Nanohaloarchaea archaeon]
MRDGLEHAVSGGKRLRTLLCLRTCNALNGDQMEAEVFAQAVESLHNATLVHDDIQDGDEFRRGKPSIWKQYGKPQAIGIGEALFAEGYRHILDHRDRFGTLKCLRLLEIYNEAQRTVIDGQAMDISFRNRMTVSEEEYMQMARKKTGALLTASLTGAAVIAQSDSDVVERLEQAGRFIGPAFQIRDDVIDIKENDSGRRGNDIREGKRSLIVVHAFQRLSKADKQALGDILDMPRDATTDAQVDRGIELMEQASAVEEAQKTAERLIDDAREHLRDVSADGFKEVCDVVDFLVERTF